MSSDNGAKSTWRDLATLLHKNASREEIEESFRELRSAFINQNESYLFITATKNNRDVQVPAKTTTLAGIAEALHVHYANYNVNARFDELVELISIEAMTGATSRNRYFEDLGATLTDCGGALELYTKQIGDPNQKEPSLWEDLGVVPSTQQPAPSPTPGPAAGKTKGGAARKPSASAAAAAAAAARDMARVQEALYEAAAARPATQLRLLSIAASRLAADKQKGPDLVAESQAYQEVCAQVAAGRIQLEKLANVLRDESVRRQIRDYADPIFDVYEAQARSLLGRLRLWITVVIAGGVGSFVAMLAAGHYWPYLGQPSWLVAALSVVVAAYLGSLVPRGPTSRAAVRAQAERFRHALEDVLEPGASKDRKRQGADTLALLDRYVRIGEKAKKTPIWVRLTNFLQRSNRQSTEPAVPAIAGGATGQDKASGNEAAGPATSAANLTQVGAVQSGDPAKEPSKSADPKASDKAEQSPAKAQTTTEPYHWDFNFPKTTPGPLGRSDRVVEGVMSLLLAVSVGAVISALPSVGAWFGQALFPPPEAQLISMIDGREACEVASGKILWQDSGQYIVAERVPARDTQGRVVSVPTARVSTIVYGEGRTSIEPCSTQDLARESQTVTVSNNLLSVAQPTQGNASTTTHVLDVTNQTYIDGRLIDVIAPLQRYVIVPFVQDVQGLVYARQQPTRSRYFQDIYDFYWQHDRKAVGDVLKPIIAALGSSLDAGCDVTIDVQGFASKREFLSETDLSNFYLAEGRRNIVLTMLGFEDGYATSKIAWVPGEWGPPAASTGGIWRRGTLRLGVMGSPVAIEDAPFPIRARFGSFQEMKDNLHQWYAEPAPEYPSDVAARSMIGAVPGPVKPAMDDDVALREAIARSVVIGILQSSLAQECPAALPSTTPPPPADGLKQASLR